MEALKNKNSMHRGSIGFFEGLRLCRPSDGRKGGQRLGLYSSTVKHAMLYKIESGMVRVQEVLIHERAIGRLP